MKAFLRVLTIFVVAAVCCGASNFKEIGEYQYESSGGLIRVKKFYYDTKAMAKWTDVSSICKANNMEFVSLDTKAEEQFLLNKINETMGNETTFNIGGKCDNITSCYWLNSGQKVNYELGWTEKQPDYEHQLCMQIWHRGIDNILCNTTKHYICQKVYHKCDSNHDTKVINSNKVKIDALEKAKKELQIENQNLKNEKDKKSVDLDKISADTKLLEETKRNLQTQNQNQKQQYEQLISENEKLRKDNKLTMDEDMKLKEKYAQLKAEYQILLEECNY